MLAGITITHQESSVRLPGNRGAPVSRPGSAEPNREKSEVNRVTAREAGALRDAVRLARFEVATGLEHGSTAVKLDRLLGRFSEQLLLARVPLFLMVFLVTGILAYYLALVAGLMVRSRNSELSMLKSRGATTFQIGVLVLVEGLLLAVPAVILGTLLAPFRLEMSHIQGADNNFNIRDGKFTISNVLGDEIRGSYIGQGYLDLESGYLKVYQYRLIEDGAELFVDSRGSFEVSLDNSIDVTSKQALSGSIFGNVDFIDISR